jgi:hypothetical protein
MSQFHLQPGPSCRRALLLAVIAVLCSSCGETPIERITVFPVKGQVLLNGKPVKGALVTFHPISSALPKNITPTGHTDENGDFAITTYEKEDGAPAGDYGVTITMKTNPSKRQTVHEPLKGKYSDSAHPRFQAHINQQPNQLPTYQLEI